MAAQSMPACPDLPLTLFADDSASSLGALRGAGKALVVDFCAARRRWKRARATTGTRVDTTTGK